MKSLQEAMPSATSRTNAELKAKIAELLAAFSNEDLQNGVDKLKFR
ncbi:MAG: hypothetical protein ACYTXA_05810 [Nostoc sp.]